ncbi:hypothetical protein MTR67_015959 [Solanum verrucosum]|uniref:Metal tolerance protein n=1 Tax=Solanum verrucosum TaxID=315347 RepID=A0AAF0QEZ6_SOLVR|nr:hypothetical protein MTR67_015959 [Solanum verrucosum]
MDFSGVSLVMAIQSVRKGAVSEGMKDGASVAGLVIAGASLVAVNITGNPIYDPIIVGNLLGMVAVFLIQRNRHALIGRAIDDKDLKKVMKLLILFMMIGPGFFRFKAEIDFNGVKLVQNYLNRAGRKQAVKHKDDAVIMEVMSHYGEEVVTALGAEVDRLEKEIQKIVPGIKHVDIEAHSSIGSSP